MSPDATARARVPHHEPSGLRGAPDAPAVDAVAVDAVDAVDTAVYAVPTETPEADGTLSWDSTELVVVRVRAAGTTGLGWAYGSPAAAGAVREARRRARPFTSARDPGERPR